MKTKLILVDEVNIEFRDLDLTTRTKMVSALKFKDPKARYMTAHILGRWDGTISYCTRGGASYFNLLDKLIPIVEKAGYEIEIVDQRKPFRISLPQIDETYLSDYKWPAGHRFAGQPIKLEEHQVRVINGCITNLQSVQSVSTGAGKTISVAALSKLCNDHGRTVIIVPNIDLVLQTEDDYKLLGLDVGVIYGDRKEFKHKHTICTWQSLNSLDKQAKTRMRGQVDFTFEEVEAFIQDTIAVIVDEVHQSKATALRNLLTGPFAHVPIRWGLSGTIPKEDYEFFSLLSAIGPVVGNVTAKELQDKGFLAGCHIDILQLIEPVNFGGFEWQDELRYLTTDPARIEYIADRIRTISESGNTVVLVDRLDAGKALEKLLPGSVFVSGSMKTKKRKVQYDEINVADKKIVIATYGVAAVGLNIPRIFNLVILEAGKSFTRTIQSIGRGLRKAIDKENVHIFDICATTRSSHKHMRERVKYYKDANYSFEITKIDYLKYKR